MAKAVMSHHWDQTSVIWATYVNSQRDPKRGGKTVHPEDIHPFRDIPTVPFEMLKAVIGGSR